MYSVLPAEYLLDKQTGPGSSSSWVGSSRFDPCLMLVWPLRTGPSRNCRLIELCLYLVGCDSVMVIMPDHERLELSDNHWSRRQAACTGSNHADRLPFQQHRTPDQTETAFAFFISVHRRSFYRVLTQYWLSTSWSWTSCDALVCENVERSAKPPVWTRPKANKTDEVDADYHPRSRQKKSLRTRCFLYYVFVFLFSVFKSLVAIKLAFKQSAAWNNFQLSETTKKVFKNVIRIE